MEGVCPDLKFIVRSPSVFCLSLKGQSIKVLALELRKYDIFKNLALDSDQTEFDIAVSLLWWQCLSLCMCHLQEICLLHFFSYKFNWRSSRSRSCQRLHVVWFQLEAWNLVLPIPQQCSLLCSALKDVLECTLAHLRRQCEYLIHLSYLCCPPSTFS